MSDEKNDPIAAFNKYLPMAEEEGLVPPGTQPIEEPRQSLWQRFKVKLFGGEGTVRDLFR